MERPGSGGLLALAVPWAQYAHVCTTADGEESQGEAGREGSALSLLHGGIAGSPWPGMSYKGAASQLSWDTASPWSSSLLG